MYYRGLIVDFGGVVTTDLSAELSAFCVREGLDPGAFARVLRDDREDLIATDELGVSPPECVYADDTAANLPAAEELGMATVHFTGAAAGIAEISRLLGLP